MSKESWGIGGSQFMKSYIKLFGTSIDKGLDALNDLIKELEKKVPIWRDGLIHRLRYQPFH